MTKNLVIVESPSKSKTIGKYLGSSFYVTSSKGHIRDLATSGKGGLGVDIENEFKPTYVVSDDKKQTVKELKANVKQADVVYLATDPDREGEAISWHLAEVLGLDVSTCHRVVFNEVTKGAVQQAIANPRTIDMDLVRSQETRRVLDRIIGFKLSTLLKSKIKSKSAGRVQSVALKLIVEKEREIQAFVPEEYWDIHANFNKDNIDFSAELSKYNNKKVKIANQEQAEQIFNALDKNFVVKDVKKTSKKRESKPPFITSTLQQEASTKLGFPAKKTMRIAQKLYEGVDLDNETVGLITYMRTDSIRLSDVFINDANRYIEQHYGKNYKGRIKVSNKTENVQDAHEAIRPTLVDRDPKTVKPFLTNDEYKLYKMIYARALASLMAPSKFDATTVLLDNNGYEFKTNGSVQTFDGYLKLYKDYEQSKDTPLPHLEVGEVLESTKIEKNQHFTNPPARYTEAKLIKEMEELGIGRPSTYATIIDTIVSRDYVELVEKTFRPTESGFLTNDKLQEFFSAFINVEYTANMESQLDKIAEGEDTYLHALQEFDELFEPLLKKAYEGMEKIQPKKTGEVCPECGGDLVERKGRYGTFIACGNYPKCKYVKKDETTKQEEPQQTGENCPNCGSPMVVKKGRFGTFEACSNYPSCKYIKPKVKETNATPEIVEGETCPNCGGQVVMKKGRFGPFMACINYPKCKTIIKKKKEKDE